MEQRIKQDATNRAELDYARRRAIESVLLSHGLMKYGPDVETNFSAQRVQFKWALQCISPFASCIRCARIDDLWRSL